MLGPAWLDSVPLFRLLAPAAAVSAMGYGWGMLLIALGQTQKYRRIGIASGVIVVVSFIVGVPFGTQGVALAYSIALCLMVIPAQWIITRDTPVRLLDVFRSWLPPVVAAIVATIRESAGLEARACRCQPMAVGLGRRRHVRWRLSVDSDAGVRKMEFFPPHPQRTETELKPGIYIKPDLNG